MSATTVMNLPASPSAVALNPKRTWLLIRNGLAMARTPAILIAAASGVTLLLYFLTSIGGGSPAFHQTLFPIVITLLGFIVSSFAFQEIHDPRTGVYALTGPGSVLEKYVSRLVLTSIGWTAAMTLAYMLTTVVGAGLSELVLGRSHGIFVPATRAHWSVILNYLLAQSVFVFGSIYFKKSAFLKTVLAAVVLALIYGLFFMIVWRLAYWNVFRRVFPSDAEVNAVMEAIKPQAIRLAATLGRIMDNVGRYVMTVFFWVVGYLRLRETEV